jgi:putative oxidoreductase
LQRLFSTFARGLPGIGLLLIRLVVGVGVIMQAVEELLGGPPFVREAMDVFAAIAGVLLLAGLWTPVAGVLVAVLELFTAFFSRSHGPLTWAPFIRPGCILLGTLGVSLALLGPGAWSVDARLFGWRRIDIRDRED